MLITLEDLQNEINQNGVVGEYKNGKDQYGTKQSAELQAYNQTLRSYNAVIGKLLKIVPLKPIPIESATEKFERLRREREAERLEFIRSIQEQNFTIGGDIDEDTD